MDFLFKKCCTAWSNEGILALRVALGAVFMYHGYDKMMKGNEMIAGFMGSIGLPFPSLMAYLVTYGELVGGLLLIVGAMTYWVTLMDIVIALVAFFFVHMTKGFSAATGGFEYIMLIGAASFALMTLGAGKYSVDALMEKKDGQM